MQRELKISKAPDTGGVPGKNASNAAQGKDFLNSESADRKEQKRLEADARQRLAAKKKPLEQKLNELEKSLKAFNAERANIEAWLSTEEAYLDANKIRLQDMLKRQGEVATEVSDVEWKWLDMQQKLEEVA